MLFLVLLVYSSLGVYMYIIHKVLNDIGDIKKENEILLESE